MPEPPPDLHFPSATKVLRDAVASAQTPAVAIEVGRRAGPLWTQAFGRLSYSPDAPPATANTVFDLASLTKVIATTSFAMRHAAAGRLDLGAPLARYLQGWTDGNRARITIRHLLDHSSGLPAHARIWTEAQGRPAYERVFAALPLEAAPGARAEYSDIAFMLLGFVLEDVAGRSLTQQMAELNDELALGALTYLPPSAWRRVTAPTEVDPWRGRLLVGEVHDENAAALGGAAGHAGLFGTAGAVGRFAQAVLAALAHQPPGLQALPLAAEFARPSDVPGSSRALGWDTMRPTSSCGTRLSRAAIGHTGFTGTSLWIDPLNDLYVVLLSNRVHPTRENVSFRATRPRVHDAVVDDLCRTSYFELRA
jgi:CubicO group peptidase (beta-lactamase class C family)